MRRLFLLLLLLYPLSSFAQITRVIYITLDGTRWQDVYAAVTPFEKLWQKHAGRGVFYGGPNSPMQVATTPISLPSYQSQMSGAIQPCQDNYCGRIRVETMPEYLLRVYQWPKKDIAIFSSWDKLEYAIQHVPNTIYANVGNVPVYEPDSNKADPVMQELNEHQAKKPHPTGNRYDEFTFAQAMHYFDRYQPKFLWISLVNADDAAHAIDWNLYQKTLKYYDDALDQLITYLDNKKLLKETMIIISTDHGRGNGINWPYHGPLYPESRNMWAFVINGELYKAPVHVRYSTLSIRPTVETVFKKITHVA